MNQRKNKKDTSNRKTEGQQSSYNGWQFARDFFDNVFSLLNTGKIFPVIILACLMMSGLILWKYPAEKLPHLITAVLSSIGSNWMVLFILLVLTNLLWVILFSLQKKMYENEIVRLSDIRSQLMHGSETLNKISSHRSSDGIQQEGYIFPNPTKN